jgi:SnoaL-like domain
MFGISFVVLSGFGQSKKTVNQVKNSTNMEPLEIVNKYLNIIFVENNNGEGLSDILAKDFVFDDPFTVARGAKDFISKTQNWIKTSKTFKMEKQFVDNNSVCSLYLITVQTPNGKTETFQLNDCVELRDDKISQERVYFFDPLKFAKTMGFLDNYVKAYQ